MTEQRDVAADFMAALGRAEGTTPQQQTAQPAAAGAPAAAEVRTPWGTTSDPKQALAELQADPSFMAALLDSGSPAHAAAVQRRSALFQAAYGNERGDQVAGNGYGGMAEGVNVDYHEPTEAEMQRAFTTTAGAILERHGLDTDTSEAIATAAIGAGLSVVDVSTVAEAIANGREYSSPEEARAELDAETIELAQQAANKLRLPAELLDLQLGNLCLGEMPQVVRHLARLARTFR